MYGSPTTLVVAAAAVAALSVDVEAAASKFSYHGNSEFNPSNWGALVFGDGTENECDGLKNSPIDIASSEDCDANADYTFTPGNCRLQDLTFSVSDHGVKGSFPDASVCTAGEMVIPLLDPSTKFVPIQFHIHTSSEHRVDGATFGAELHIVHQQVGGDRLAVVGLFLQPDAAYNHDDFGRLLTDWNMAQTQVEMDCGACSVERGRALKEARSLQEALEEGTAFDIYQLIPRDNTAFYHYDGGLTTPPCSEVVWWNVAETPVRISLSQYTQLTRLILDYRDETTCRKRATIASASGSTSRPVQPLHGRIVERVCSLPPPAEETQTQSRNGASSDAARTFGGISSLMLVGAMAVTSGLVAFL